MNIKSGFVVFVPGPTIPTLCKRMSYRELVLSILNKFKKKKIEHPHFAEGKSAFYNGLTLSENPYGIDSPFYSQWASGWAEGSKTRQVFEAEHAKQTIIDRVTAIDWDTIYPIGGFITGAIAFIACWIYAVVLWGFLIGVGLGWIPSLFIAIIAGFIWPLLMLLLVVGIAIIAFLLWKT